MFKVGDWVRNNWLNTIKQYSTQDYNYDKTYNGTENESKYWELWTPKVGEWCWFYEDGSFPTLGQYGGDNGGNRHWMKSHPLDLWERVEPFIGKLPSFLKD